MSAMPIEYANSANAWMTSILFKEWFAKTFVPQVRKHLRKMKVPVKAVLLLDNCPAHPPAEILQSRDGNIKVLYLPKNTTSKIQPLDQGIISSLKRHYRKELVKDVICSELSVIEFLKKINLKDMFFLTAKAWELVTPKTITNCWNHALKGIFPANNPDASDDEDEEFLGFTPAEVREAELKLRHMLDSDQCLDSYLDQCATLDDDCPVYQEQTDKEIIEEVQGTVEEEEEVTDEPADKDEPIPSASETSVCLQTALRYFETQDVDPIKILQLRGLLQWANKKFHDNLKQRKLTDFFTK
jgi:hypothetical protein